MISPADGRVLVAGPAESAGAPPGTWQQVSIFLSPMDVHVNRVPIGGRVTRVLETPGTISPGVPRRSRKPERADGDLD